MLLLVLVARFWFGKRLGPGVPRRASQPAARELACTFAAIRTEESPQSSPGLQQEGEQPQAASIAWQHPLGGCQHHCSEQSAACPGGAARRAVGSGALGQP